MTLARFRVDARGVTAVELALTFPFFMFLVLGTIQAGVILWTQLAIENAVAAAARCAVVDTTVCTNASTTATYASQNAFGLSLPASVFASSQTACGQQVTATYSVPLLPSYFGSTTISLNAQSCLPT